MKNLAHAGAWLLILVVAPVACAQAPAQAPKAAPAAEPAWQSMFDGKSLGKWKATRFGGENEVQVKDGEILLLFGAEMTGVTWSGELPKIDYEISLEAKRVDGTDFFCGLTFPINDAPCSFIVGGWGGGVVGISSINGQDASENETTKYKEFDSGRWYRIRVRVTADKLQAWVDKEEMVDVDLKGKRISIRGEVEASRPLGICSYATTAALRDIKIRKLK